MGSTAGRFALVKMGGTPTTFTDEAVTVVTTNKKYQIASATKEVWDPTFTIAVKAAGVAVDPVADPYVINRLLGTITFTNTSARGTVTVSGKYLPMTTIGKCKSYSTTITSAPLDDTTFDSVGWTELLSGINDAAATLGRNWESVAAALFQTALTSGAVLVLQFFGNRNNAADMLMWAYPTKETQNVDVTAIITDDLEFVGTADADGRVVSIA